MSILDNEHGSNQAKVPTKGEPFYKLMGSEIKQMYKAKLLDAPAYVLLIVKCHGKAGWKWTFKVRDFCQEWGISKSAFYRAVSKLKTLGMLHWEAGETITVWHSADIAISKTILQEEYSPYSGNDSPYSGNDSPYSGNDSPYSGNVVSLGGIKKPEAPINTGVRDTSDSSQSYSDFKKTLSDSEREFFEKFVREEWKHSTGQDVISMERFLAGEEDLKNWQTKFFNSPVGRDAKKKAEIAAVAGTDWTQHPDWENWLAMMRESVPRFVALGTCFDNKTRRAIADWALEHNLVWGAES